MEDGINDTIRTLNMVVADPPENMITWLESWKNIISAHAAPLHVGELVQSHLWERLDSVIMTSATMRTAPQGRYREANFDYIKSRLNAGQHEELALGSPFDYKKNALVYLCSDIPEPRQPGYQRHVEQAIIDAAKTLGGRTLVLFTSYKQLRETAAAIRAPLHEEGIITLAQTSGSSRQKLTEQFKNPDTKTVLLGTRSFWEGVDVPGKRCAV